MFLSILCSVKIEQLLLLKFLKNLALFDSYFRPFKKNHEKIIAIFVISGIKASIWNVFIKFCWHDEKLTVALPIRRVIHFLIKYILYVCLWQAFQFPTILHIIIHFYERNELIVLWEIGKPYNQNIRGVLRRTQATFMMLYFQFPYI